MRLQSRTDLGAIFEVAGADGVNTVCISGRSMGTAASWFGRRRLGLAHGGVLESNHFYVIGSLFA